MEVTPIGIQNLQWKFYIIWTIFNASFVPIVYLFYPETSDRTLEDMDRLFREDQSILVFRNKDAISRRRPAKWQEYEDAEVRRHSSVDAAALRKMSRVGYVHEKRNTGDSEAPTASEGAGDEFHEKI